MDTLLTTISRWSWSSSFYVCVSAIAAFFRLLDRTVILICRNWEAKKKNSYVFILWMSITISTVSVMDSQIAYERTFLLTLFNNCLKKKKWLFFAVYLAETMHSFNIIWMWNFLSSSNFLQYIGILASCFICYYCFFGVFVIFRSCPFTPNKRVFRWSIKLRRGRCYLLTIVLYSTAQMCEKGGLSVSELNGQFSKSTQAFESK